MAAPKLTPEVELVHRNKLIEDLQRLRSVGAIFDKMTFFASQQDFIDLVALQPTTEDDLQVQFCQVSFLGFEDDPDDPCIDNPSVKLVYKMHFFHEFIQQRKDGSNSHDTFTAMILNVRNMFLATVFSVSGTEREPAKLQNFIITDDESEFFKGAYGHWCNMITKIEIE